MKVASEMMYLLVIPSIQAPAARTSILKHIPEFIWSPVLTGIGEPIRSSHDYSLARYSGLPVILLLFV